MIPSPTRRVEPRVPARPALSLILTAAAAACGPAPPVPVCASLTPRASASGVAAPTDTLDLPVVLLSPGSGAVELLVRVDPVAEEGIVRFAREGSPPPAPTVAGAGVILAPGARYRICFGERPAALTFQAEEAPHGKVWVRVSTDRPVRAWIQGPRDGVGAPSGALRVAPGASGKTVFLPGRDG